MQRCTPWLEAAAGFEQGKGKVCQEADPVRWDSAFHHVNVLPYRMAENSIDGYIHTYIYTHV